MPDPSAEPTRLESALELLTETIEAWDPDTNSDVAPMLEALRALQLRFDTRKDRLSASLCMTSMKLLEQVADRGRVGPEAAIAVVGELSRGLRESLRDSLAAPAFRPGSQHTMVTLKAPKEGASALSLSLAVDSVKEQTIGELMVRMNMLTREQADHVLAVQAKTEPWKRFGEVAIELGYASEWTIENALRLQARGRGEVPPDHGGEADPWGGNPL